MAYQIIITTKAERDLEGIRDFIARDNPEIADDFCAELVREAKSLRTFPHRISEFAKRPNVRKMPFRSYLIFYRLNESTRTLEILRFWHASRNQKRLRLKEDAPAYGAELLRRQAASGEGAVIPGDEVLLRQSQAQQ